MSSTMTFTTSQTLKSTSSCPACGTGLPLPSDLAASAQKQIEDLQAQVRLLTQKATAAVDKWADYEDEIRRLRAVHINVQSPGGLDPGTTTQHSLPIDERASSPIRNSMQGRFSAFLTPRKSTPNLQAPLPAVPPPTPSETELVAALTREQTLRQQAEGKLDQASDELEELSTQLFMQANEMVATERKARARLEERVEVLERRDGEKRRRLERLEGAVARIERVRGLLVEEKEKEKDGVGNARREGGLG